VIGQPDLERLGGLLDRRLASTDAALASSYPGSRAGRQPIHTVYIPADRFDADTVKQWSESAVRALAEHGGSAATLARVTGIEQPLVEEVLLRVERKLVTEPIEDLRIDFEDGFGSPPDDTEDAAVAAAVVALHSTRSCGEGSPTFAGIRFKSFEAPTRRRGLRTLVQYLTAANAQGLVGETSLLTLPKVTAVPQVSALVEVLEQCERDLGIMSGHLTFEIQVETPQSILGADGTALVSRMIQAAKGRCTALHYGTYDYSASVGIAAEYQSMEHPAADHAKAVMQVAAAGTGVALSDGSTNVLPVGTQDAVHRAWGLHARLVARSLHRGFYQGWDLHPAQLPTRYLATYTFYRRGFRSAARRLAAYLGSGDATNYLDEPATAKALAGFVMRGLDCGALDEAETTTAVGADPSALAALAGRPPTRC
jgi:citrate lyase beta subunit